MSLICQLVITLHPDCIRGKLFLSCILLMSYQINLIKYFFLHFFYDGRNRIITSENNIEMIVIITNKTCYNILYLLVKKGTCQLLID